MITKVRVRGDDRDGRGDEEANPNLSPLRVRGHHHLHRGDVVRGRDLLLDEKEAG